MTILRNMHRMIRWSLKKIPPDDPSSERSTARWFPEITVHRIIRCSLENTHRIIRCSLENTHRIIRCSPENTHRIIRCSLENHRKIRCSLENHRKIRWCWIAEHRIIRWSQKHTESIANVMFERLTEQTFSKSDEDLIKGVPRHPKDSTKRTPWKNHRLIKKSTKTGMNLEFSLGHDYGAWVTNSSRISPQMYSLKLQPWIPQENPSPKGLKHNKPKSCKRSKTWERR